MTTCFIRTCSCARQGELRRTFCTIKWLLGGSQNTVICLSYSDLCNYFTTIVDQNSFIYAPVCEYNSVDDLNTEQTSHMLSCLMRAFNTPADLQKSRPFRLLTTHRISPTLAVYDCVNNEWTSDNSEYVGACTGQIGKTNGSVMPETRNWKT